MSLHKDMGQKLSGYVELDVLVVVLNRIDMADHEELVLNILNCISNLSYYSKQDDHFFNVSCTNLVSFLPLLMSGNIEVVIETERIIANITRYKLDIDEKVLSNCILLLIVVKVITILLDHQEQGIIELTSGILINLLAKNTFCNIVIDSGGIEKYIILIRLLDIIGFGIKMDKIDVSIGALKALYNLWYLNSYLGLISSKKLIGCTYLKRY